MKTESVSEPTNAAEQTADELEVEAFRAACARFFSSYVGELLARTGLQPLAGSGHMHRTLIVDETKGNAVVLTARFDFGDLVATADVAELIAASSSPATVVES